LDTQEGVTAVSTTVLVLIIVIAVLIIALVVGGVFFARARRSQQLQDHYGPEYERSLRETGDRRAAEAQLTDREKRHAKLDTRELDDSERERFAASWTSIQRGFVDDPKAAVRQADSLVVDIMKTRGFPTDDADQRTETLSVEHPQIVDRYRKARAVRDATEQGAVDTEQQRHAVTSYRELIEALLGSGTSVNGHAAAKEQIG
jgi:FtsZ-interacting cell division protein ZipA